MNRVRRHIVVIIALVAMGAGVGARAEVNVGYRPDSTHFVDGTKVYPKDALYQGMCVRYDLGGTLMTLAMSKGKIQSYDFGMNWRLRQRFYPTVEMGYACADTGADGGHHCGQGGFLRMGVDINGLKKHPERLDGLLVGIRLATDVQQYSLTHVTGNDPYGVMNDMSYENLIRADFWGEVVAGCQVQIYAGFMMGWTIRLKVLATRTDKNNGPLPYYIPGYGYRDETNWGFNYWVGYRF